MIDRLKRIVRVLKGKDFFYNVTTTVKKERIGSKYGGWWISTEPTDGKDLVILSFGLGEDISFDIAMINRFDCKVYGFDPTPKSIEYLNSLNLDERFSLQKYALSNGDGSLFFNLPENEEHVSGSLENINSNNSIEVKCKTLQTILNQLNISSIDILKMDIEGSEYKVIKNMIDSEIFPKQILIEYHHFFESFKNNDTIESIEFLLNNGYELFAIEGYNYSFVRK